MLLSAWSCKCVDDCFNGVGDYIMSITSKETEYDIIDVLKQWTVYTINYTI